VRSHGAWLWSRSRAIRPDWTGAGPLDMSTKPPHVSLYDDTPCKEGLTQSSRVSCDPTGSSNCEELLVITTSGAEVVTDAPRPITYIQ
jgi:hypothetical protein